MLLGELVAFEVFGAITFDIVASSRGNIGDDSEVTCGIVVSSRKGKGDGRLVDDRAIFSAMTP